jgi:hypothetical protein
MYAGAAADVILICCRYSVSMCMATIVRIPPAISVDIAISRDATSARAIAQTSTLMRLAGARHRYASCEVLWRNRRLTPRAALQ